MFDARSRVSGPWLEGASLRRVFSALTADGHEARVVGGAVRNALMRRPVKEIDIATTALPREIIEAAARARLGAHPTGIDHGTITVVADGDAFEVTTLRRDIATDGRHAVVAFTRNWHEDAQRRDFTVNALYCDSAGRIEDFVGGLDDLRKRRVRFIGDASERIREDYLRILRFFRFTADFGNGQFDDEGLNAAVALRDGIKNLSPERIRGEILKILAAPKAAEVVRVMHAYGILDIALNAPSDPPCLARLQAIEAALGQPPDPLARLAALAVSDIAAAANLASRLRLSNAEAARLETAVASDSGLDPATPEAIGRGAVYRLGADAFRRAIRVAWARSAAAATCPRWRARALLPDRWQPPALPFSGADLIARGIAPGPKIGNVLRHFEAWWIASDFPSDADALAGALEKIAAEANS